MKKKIKVDLITPIEQQLKDLGIKNYLDLSEIMDLYPSRQYLEDIDDGKSMRGFSPVNARKAFAEKNRQGLTLREGLALLRENPKILKSHNLDFVGSRCDDGSVPCLDVRGDKPALSSGWEVNAYPMYGAPSAGSVSELEPRNLDPLVPLKIEILEMKVRINEKIYNLVEVETKNS